MGDLPNFYNPDPTARPEIRYVSDRAIEWIDNLDMTGIPRSETAQLDSFV